MTEPLPTGSFGEWSVTSFKDSLISLLTDDRSSDSVCLRFYFYAVTACGWSEIREAVASWRSFAPSRTVTAYVGTDHAITDPNGLETMRDDGVAVRLMQSYRGLFHPKVVLLVRPQQSMIWVGSNNLTRDGLLNNVEFAVLVRFPKIPPELEQWSAEVHEGSTALTAMNLQCYRDQRDQFSAHRIRIGATDFIWRGRYDSLSARSLPARAGDLVVEIMPRETGIAGTQIQLPLRAAREYFGVTGSKKITLSERGYPGSERPLKMTLFRNLTIRLTISELHFSDRPCVIVFHRTVSNCYEFVIVRESTAPSEYRRLLDNVCRHRSRAGSRRWGIMSEQQ